MWPRVRQRHLFALVAGGATLALVATTGGAAAATSGSGARPAPYRRHIAAAADRAASLRSFVAKADDGGDNGDQGGEDPEEIAEQADQYAEARTSPGIVAPGA